MPRVNLPPEMRTSYAKAITQQQRSDLGEDDSDKEEEYLDDSDLKLSTNERKKLLLDYMEDCLCSVCVKNCT